MSIKLNRLEIFRLQIPGCLISRIPVVCLLGGEAFDDLLLDGRGRDGESGAAGWGQGVARLRGGAWRCRIP